MPPAAAHRPPGPLRLRRYRRLPPMVDVDVCAGGDSTRRKMDALTDSAVEIVPLELYDSARAKIAANLQWICAKAYGIDNVPEELKDPFYIDQYEQEHIKPPVIKLLLSSELYCRVCSLILKADQVAALQGHQSVIQALSRKGIYVMESDDTPVSESDLGCAPIKMSSHMAMIDALMMAYTVEMISIEKVVASVKRFSTFSASKELPYDLEDAMVFWINKVNLKMREITEKEIKLKQQLMESPGHQKSPSKWYWKLVPVRYRRDHLSSRQLPYFPLLEDLMKDGSDGAALLAVIHYYCPEHMKLDDICLKEVTSIADSLYNIQLLREFSNEYLNKCFYLTLEDMLYAPLVLKPNVMVFIAELFWWFENVKPDFVQPRDIQEIKDVKTVLQQKSSRPPVPISNATKRSFMASPAGSGPAELSPAAPPAPDACSRYYLHPEEPDYLGKGGNPAFSPSHPLLPLRQKQQKSLQGEDSPGHRHRSNSLTRVDGQPRGSVLAWPERKPRPLSQPTPFALHHSASSDVDPGSGDSISLARSISKDSLASNIVNIEDEDEELIAIIRSEERPNRSDHELQNASARVPGIVTTAWSPKTNSETSEGKQESFYLEPLMPALLKPAKEKQIINKEEDSDFAPVAEAGAADSAALMEAGLEAARPLASSSLDPSTQELSTGGFFLHAAKSDDDIANLLDIEDTEEDLVVVGDHPIVAKYIGEEESAKLQEDMKLEEKRRAIEAQKKKMEALSARQRLKLGKAAFLHVVKKGKSPDVPQPLKPEHFAKEYSRHNEDNVTEVDINECDLSIEKLNETISTLQQAILKISQQQELLMKSPSVPSPGTRSNSQDQKTPTEIGLENSLDLGNGSQEQCFFDTYRLHDESNQRALVLSTSKDANIISEMSKEMSNSFKESGLNSSDGSGKENVPVDEPLRSKANLIEVDLSDLKAPDEGELENQDSSTDIISEADQKSGVGFFFKDEQKAEDELAKKRAAFLLKQQRKAEEARIRKQQLEAEVEQKRDEARRKAEEDRIRKEEEKARRELIKQEYLRKKQQQILEEQGLGKPKSKPKKPRPKSVHREESYSDSGTKCSSTPDNLSSAQSGSSLSLASAATTEPESVHSGGTPAQRVESMESLPILSRNPSRNTERDWENASTASSIASVAEYTGPKLFKEPSSKSNKHIIHNAISHCCLAGKVNEPHKNSILEELEKCDANHYIILFRDAGCQFRALYCYYPDTEEIYKLTGTGPKSITKKMIDKLYKYSSDRKQFNVIPAKTMSVSVDALTIHNHLWQAKRPAVPKKTQTRKSH
ncbi:calmodulin-regulated spectrin-associated protein 1 isoform C [Patagioenas fasciata monilis]|uniref:Calmodulin-regulated spectrin-associated protein 1 isoform C n=1 Tax=Patagioenas fasciata monilis TaxID=372326 RepID=A0A1V4J5Y8_PATFA|nr:calmodulin-regulated spectrin-associated protein 1 isoform C [Patagioenas fasciata monilis]